MKKILIQRDNGRQELVDPIVIFNKDIADRIRYIHMEETNKITWVALVDGKLNVLKSYKY